jgi:2-dehydro-3-deoxygalactonokinase
MAEPDVMRGEETQIAGFLAANPGYDGMLCLPGTHSKWARVHAGRIERFRTFMTGELFALITSQSVLRHTTDSNGWDEAAFETAVGEIAANPEALTGKLFGLRAGPLLTGMPPEAARARLSGL